MKKVFLYSLWLFLYALCAGLAYIPNPEGLQSAALTALALIFFVPGVILLIDALRAKDKKHLLLLRWICITVLALTLVLLGANVISALGSQAMGDALFDVLIFVSVPMICSQHWLMILFLWACLLFATFLGQKPSKK